MGPSESWEEAIPPSPSTIKICSSRAQQQHTDRAIATAAFDTKVSVHGATHLSECAWLRRYRSPQRACVATFSVANSSVWKTPGNADAPSEVTSGAKEHDRVSGAEVLRLGSAR